MSKRNFFFGFLVFVFAALLGMELSGGIFSKMTSHARVLPAMQIPERAPHALIVADEQKRRLLAGWQTYQSLSFESRDLVDQKTGANGNILETYEESGQRAMRLVDENGTVSSALWIVGEYRFSLTFAKGQPLWLESEPVVNEHDPHADEQLFLVISYEHEPRSFLHALGDEMLLEFALPQQNVKFRWWGQSLAADYDEAGNLLAKYDREAGREWVMRDREGHELGQGSFNLRMEFVQTSGDGGSK